MHLMGILAILRGLYLRVRNIQTDVFQYEDNVTDTWLPEKIEKTGFE